MPMKKLRYGNTNTYFVNGLLFDTDMPGTINAFFKEIKNNGISISDIKYVIASHYHPDHIGLIGELMKMGIKLIILENQLENVHFSDEIFRRQFADKFSPIDEQDATVISFNESRQFLSSIGIQGEIIPTSSHSEDGIALILDDGNCFVGDLEPRQYIDGYESNTALKNDWETIMEYHPKAIHFGHVNSLF